MADDPSEELHDSSVFEVDFPVWVVADNNGLITQSVARYGSMFPFFTDKDLAQRFVEGRSVHSSTVEVSSNSLLIAMLLTLRSRAGVNYVIIDCNPLNQRPGGVVQSVAAFVTAAQKRKSPPE